MGLPYYAQLRLLNAQGRWEPFTKDGIRGWILIAVVVGVPTILALISLFDVVKAEEYIQTLITKKNELF